MESVCALKAVIKMSKTHAATAGIPVSEVEDIRDVRRACTQRVSKLAERLQAFDGVDKWLFQTQYTQQRRYGRRTQELA